VIHLDRQPAPAQAERGDQIGDRRAALDVGFGPVQTDLHARGIAPLTLLYNLTEPWYRRTVALLTGPVAHVDLGAIVDNYFEVVRIVGDRVRVMAMVKADAYGHGDAEVARALAAAGCRDFGVATLEEAARVRAAAPAARLIVFGGIDPRTAEAAVELGVEIVTQEADVIRALGGAASSSRREIGVHVKVDTGMRRLGAEVGEAAALIELARDTAGCRPIGLCSHFAMAESVTTDVTAGQLERLLEAARASQAIGVKPELHMANSAAILTRPDTYLDMVRPGLMLYGLYPAAEMHSRASLRHVMRLEAPIVRLATVGPGEGIGYAHSYHTERTSRIATIRCGYADGYPRALSNRAEVTVGGRRVPVVGRVCMDHLMVDVTDAGNVRVGESAVLWGSDVSIEEVAERASTISYEIVARLGARVRRHYHGARGG